MKLLYLWIESYKNIRKQGFNFGGKYKFDFDPMKKKLSYKPNKDYIPNFFGENVDVTAIVGKNGSGKSSVLKLLLNYSYENDYFIIYYNDSKNNNSELGTYKVFNNTNIDLSDFEIKTDKKFLIKKKHLNKKKPSYLGTILKDIKDTNIIFYSNDFQLSKFINNDPMIQNKKNNNTDYFNISSGGLLKDSLNLKKDGNIYISETYFSDIEKQVLFIENNRLIELIKNNVKDFKFPSNLKLKPDLKYFEFLKKRNTPIKNTLSKFKRNIVNIFNIIINTPNFNEVNDLEKAFIGMYLQYVFNFETIINIKLDTTSYGHLKDNTKIKEYILNHIKIINKNSEINIDTNIIEIFYREKAILFDTSLNSIDKIIKYINIYKDTIGDFNYITFEWIDNKEKALVLSSGEETLLTFIARLYNLFNKNILDITQDIILIIDEGEISLHPDWQKRYLDIIINFIKILMKELKIKNNIQIIITTHSPFILSDIPKSNAIFLDKDENGNCKVVDGINKSNTFGANIHTLLSDSFFMEDGTMGEFAKKKINDVITFLNLKLDGKPQNLELNMTQKDAEGIISIIGEPFLKEKLEEMYFRAFKDDKEARKEALLRQREAIDKELEGLND